MEFLEAGPDLVRASMPVDDRVRQGLGLVHGGALVALADVTATAAAYASGPADRDQVTVELHARFVGAARDGPLVAEARPLQVGRRLSFWEVKITDPAGRVVAAVEATFTSIARGG